MKDQTISFLGPDAFAKQNKVPKGTPLKAFDWDKAAKIIKEKLKDHPDLIAEAGLKGDWEYTGGCIFKDGNPTNEGFTYLNSNWAIPTIVLEWDGIEQEELDCFAPESKRLTFDSKWDDVSLKILGIEL